MSNQSLILVINPGSTSTKIGVFENDHELISANLHHQDIELNQFQRIIDQYQYRRDKIIKFLTSYQFNWKSLRAIMARGGLLKPILSGIYQVNDQMLEDLKTCKYGQHASNLGALIAHDLAEKYQIKAYIADPVVVDELWPIARISGYKGIERKSLFHALNQKNVAYQTSLSLKKSYEQCNFVIAHLGGGISVSAHYQGKVVDTNNALNGDGPFSPERSGTLPIGELLHWKKTHHLSVKKALDLISKQGGIYSYFQTRDIQKLEKLYHTSADIKIIFDALSYQVAKEIGAYATTLKGQIDGIILTGGLAKSNIIIPKIKEFTMWIAPIFVRPGENELEALNQAFWKMIANPTILKNY